MKLRAAIIASPLITACWIGKSGELGVKDGRLKPCPSSPNCVSSLTSPQDRRHYIEPLSLEMPLHQTREVMKKALLSFPRTSVVREQRDYLHVEFTTRFLRFKDDVEIYLDEKHSQIHFRSASRIGYSDMGVNRRRIESLKKKYKSLGDLEKTK